VVVLTLVHDRYLEGQRGEITEDKVNRMPDPKPHTGGGRNKARTGRLFLKDLLGDFRFPILVYIGYHLFLPDDQCMRIVRLGLVRNASVAQSTTP
jgi:hypothetical protein